MSQKQISNTFSNSIACYLLSVWNRFCFEMVFALASDPWQYTSVHAQTKYDHVLQLLLSSPISRVLELACAEGHFSVQLAPHVDRLTCADISQIALNRAAKRCTVHQLYNIEFVHLDITKDLLPGSFDLIVCSEVLYYVGGKSNLQKVCCKLADALAPGGYLITTNANRVNDESASTRSGWLRPYGAQVIGETLASTPRLQLVKEIRTAFFRTHLFQHCAPTKINQPDCSAAIVDLTDKRIPPPPEQGIFALFSLAFLYNQLQRFYKQ